MANHEVTEPYLRDLRKLVYVLAMVLVASALAAEFLPESNASPEWLIKALKGSINAFLAVGGSILAAALVPLFLHFYSDFVRKEARVKFARFFFVPPNGKVIIVMPRFKIESPPDSAQDNGVNGLCLKEFKELDRACVSIDDLVAARHISAMFAENGAPVPRIFFDDDVWRVVFGETRLDDERYKEIRECKTFIVIGIFSNAIATELNKSINTDRSFRLSGAEDAKNGNRYLEIAPMKLRSPDMLGQWRREESSFSNRSQSGSFGLLARVALPSEGVALLVGGGTARATRKVASHLRRHWLQLHDLREIERDAPIGTNSFSMEFAVSDVPNSSPERGRAYYGS
ncbi:hypothetical protein [Paraburkholderia oxyphila]|uniref:hypothetical protein n=1 Tax=Paraburkholderia oxyphila TaxID=614212 RepID=UPI0004813A28|nr:hypothetical protein [Paraburkholderia oxyphila]